MESMTVKQLRWGVPSEVVQARWPPVLQLWYYSPRLVSLLCLIITPADIAAPARETAFNGNWKYAPLKQGRMTYIGEVPVPGPWLVHFYANEDSNSSVLLIQIALSWLVRMELHWLVVEDANEDVAVQLWLGRESLSRIGQISVLGALL